MPLEVAVGVTDSLWRGGWRGAVGYRAFLEEGQVREVHQRRLGVGFSGRRQERWTGLPEVKRGVSQARSG